MKLSAETSYVQLRELVAAMPDFANEFPVTDETNRWLGRAAALVEAILPVDIASHVRLSTATAGLGSTTLYNGHVQAIKSVLYKALAAAELAAPVADRGGFVAPQSPLDALAQIAKIFDTAKTDLFIVDPYLDLSVLTDFVITAPSTTPVRLLGDSKTTELSKMEPAVRRWKQQHGAARQLECRLTAPRQLHDRLAFSDQKFAWNLSQSLKDFAKRAPATAQRLDVETADAKLHFYEGLWATATSV